MRSLQLSLNCHWEFLDDSIPIWWDNQCLRDLIWWSNEDDLMQSISFLSPLPDLTFFSDTSDLG